MLSTSVYNYDLSFMWSGVKLWAIYITVAIRSWSRPVRDSIPDLYPDPCPKMLVVLTDTFPRWLAHSHVLIPPDGSISGSRKTIGQAIDNWQWRKALSLLPHATFVKAAINKSALWVRRACCAFSLISRIQVFKLFCSSN